MLHGRLKITTVAENAALCILYAGVGKLVLQLEPVGGVAGLFWPPSGIAVAGVLLFGYRLLPGVFLGELIMGLRPGTPLLVAIMSALGIVLEVGLSAYALFRFTDFRRSLEGLRHVMVLIIPSVLTTLLGATISVASLSVGGIVPAQELWSTWRTWWIVDLLGILMITPLILSCATVSVRKVAPMRVVEAIALGGALITASVAVFFRVGVTYPLENPYVFFPLFIWAAHRFELLGATMATTIVSLFAVWGTVRGTGPFTDHTLATSMIALQTFLGCAALTPLVVAGALADRARSVHIRDDFLAVAGHELRTPLAAMLMQIESLQRSLKKDPTTSVADRLAKIAHSGVRLERLVHQLLDVSRITAGKLKLEPEPFDLTAVVQDVVARLADTSAKANCPITVTGDTDVRGRWDRLRIDQVVTNLVGNAVKYGRGKPVEIDVRLDGDAVLRITDHGIGIDVDRQRRIFQKFERAVATREFGGFGLGLWISRQIVEASGGKIEVESELGRGAVFTVRLPAERRPAYPEVHHGDRETRASGG
jgi:signal transduction histidine kinase